MSLQLSEEAVFLILLTFVLVLYLFNSDGFREAILDCPDLFIDYGRKNIQPCDWVNGGVWGGKQESELS